jgi:DNA-binding MurR/RpiR family transcriptional regulator
MAEADNGGFEGFQARLAQRSATLPKRLRQVASFLAEHPDEIALGTAAAVAARAGVQPSTLVRFAQALGYEGFSELQHVFRARLRSRFPDYRERVARLRGASVPGGVSASLLDGFTHSAALSLDRLKAGLDPALADRAIAMLAGAEIIHILAARRVFPVAVYLAYAFSKLAVRNALVDHVGQLGAEQLALATPRDAVLAISFAPYATATIELAAAASAKGVPIVAITDSAVSPLASLATLRLDVSEADYGAFRSLSATFALAMTLAVGTAEVRSAPDAIARHGT